MYPEHEKLDNEKLRAIDEVVDWLESKGYSICKLDEIGHYNGEIEYAKWRDLRAEFFGTTEELLEEERKQMLKSLQ